MLELNENDAFRIKIGNHKLQLFATRDNTLTINLTCSTSGYNTLSVVGVAANSVKLVAVKD